LLDQLAVHFLANLCGFLVTTNQVVTVLSVEALCFQLVAQPGPPSTS
jgi:hypothetical protein